MTSEQTKDHLPFTLTAAYDRTLCGECACASCYEQEFCDRCKDCREKSKYKQRCNAYEGAFNY